MKLIASLAGFVAIRYPAEDVTPNPRLPRADILNELIRRHAFVGRSDPNQTPIVLQNGSAVIDGNNLAFAEMQIFNGEVCCQAEDTEKADAIAHDLMDFFDEKFGYKFRKVEKRFAYVSTMVVEFDSGLDNVISTTKLLEDIINGACAGQRNLKRLSFGLRENESGPSQPVTPFDVAGCTDFFMERRLGSDPSANRFFCSAPLRTPAHVAVLEKLEAASSTLKVSAPMKRRRKMQI